MTVDDSVVSVGVVAGSRDHARPIVRTLDAELPDNYRTIPIAADRVEDRVDAVDAVVAQRLADRRTARTLVEANREGDVGLVLLDQHGNPSDAITRVANVTDWLEGTDQRDLGTPPVSYRVQRDYPILPEQAARGENLTIHTGRYADHVWLVNLSTGSTLAAVGDREATSGTGLAVDERRDVVFAPSLGRSQYVPDGVHTNASDRLLANSVRYVADEGMLDQPREDDPDERPRATLAVENVTLVAGETANATIQTNASGVAGYQAQLSYDPSVLEVEDVRRGDFAAGSVNLDREAGRVHVAQADAEASDAPQLATVGFAVRNESANESRLALAPSESLLNDAAGEPVPARIQNGTATVLACQPGDVNGDGRVTAGDATLIQRQIVGLPVNASFSRRCADVDGDGELTSGDVTLVLRRVVGLAGETAAPER